MATNAYDTTIGSVVTDPAATQATYDADGIRIKTVDTGTIRGGLRLYVEIPDGKTVYLDTQRFPTHTLFWSLKKLAAVIRNVSPEMLTKPDPEGMSVIKKQTDRVPTQASLVIRWLATIEQACRTTFTPDEVETIVGSPSLAKMNDMNTLLTAFNRLDTKNDSRLIDSYSVNIKHLNKWTRNDLVTFIATNLRPPFKIKEEIEQKTGATVGMLGTRIPVDKFIVPTTNGDFSLLERSTNDGRYRCAFFAEGMEPPGEGAYTVDSIANTKITLFMRQDSGTNRYTHVVCKVVLLSPYPYKKQSPMLQAPAQDIVDRISSILSKAVGSNEVKSAILNFVLDLEATTGACWSQNETQIVVDAFNKSGPGFRFSKSSNVVGALTLNRSEKYQDDIMTFAWPTPGRIFGVPTDTAIRRTYPSIIMLNNGKLPTVTELAKYLRLKTPARDTTMSALSRER